MVGGITPYAALQAQSFRTPTYSETDVNGGGFALDLQWPHRAPTSAASWARASITAGAVDPDAVLTLRARLAWAHDWVSDPTLAPVFQALPGASFIVNGAAPAKNSALASAGAELRLANGVTLIGKFDGEFASRSSDLRRHRNDPLRLVKRRSSPSHRTRRILSRATKTRRGVRPGHVA